MDHSQHLLLAIGWVHDRERLVSSFFHEVVKVDCTSSICNEDGRSLLTMSSIDSMGNTFVFLRVLIPNERAWVFKWVFQTLLTTLFPPNHFNHLKMFITDGDSQEFQQLDAAIEKYFPNVFRQRCGWHVVDRGYLKYGPKLGRHNRMVKKVMSVIIQWIYSWLKASGGIETEHECAISICLLLDFIDNNDTLQTALDQTQLKSLQSFIRERVLVHICLLYTSPSPRDYAASRMPSSA